MKINELIKHLQNVAEESGENSLIAIDININDQFKTKSEISKINIYAPSDVEGNHVITLETRLNVLGSVDTTNLVNKRIEELVDAANDAEEDVVDFGEDRTDVSQA